jgi:hypothetical protein
MLGPIGHTLEGKYKQCDKLGVCHTLWPLSLTLKNILRQKKNYGNSNISPYKNSLQKISIP